MTRLIVSIQSDSQPDIETQAARAWQNGADAVELRLDRFAGDLQELAAFLKKDENRTWILTCRSHEEGGQHRGDAAERLARMRSALGDSKAIVDVELVDMESPGDGEEDLQSLLYGLADQSAEMSEYQRLILSRHDIHDRPTQEDADALLTGGRALSVPAVAKLAFDTKHIDDSFLALDLAHQHRNEVIAIGMGEDGLWTRVLAKKLGAYGSFCSLDSDTQTAPGQLSLKQMQDVFRWNEIDDQTSVFGVIGDPVAHSMSPLMFNKWLEAHGVNGVYLPLRVREGDSAVASFLDGCRSRPWLGLRGLSVTIPHKASALAWAGDGADWMSYRVGAANTLAFNDDVTRAYNTDCYAAVASLGEAFGGGMRSLASLPVDVLGTGGAAQAILYGLPMSGCQVTVFGRNKETADALAKKYDVKAETWDRRTNGNGRVLINCTSVGMWPQVSESPMPVESLGKYDLVFDLIYNPLETQLLIDAARSGARTLNGLDMFIRQAAMQFALWTGISADRAMARSLIEESLAMNGDAES